MVKNWIVLPRGMGKTTLLMRIAMDYAMNGEPVTHIACHRIDRKPWHPLIRSIRIGQTNVVRAVSNHGVIVADDLDAFPLKIRHALLELDIAWATATASGMSSCNMLPETWQHPHSVLDVLRSVYQQEILSC